jgi:transposase InsO family protein
LKEGCVWQYTFPSFIEARRAVRRSIRWYNEGRPHQALGQQGRENFALNSCNAWLERGGALKTSDAARSAVGAALS